MPSQYERTEIPKGMEHLFRRDVLRKDGNTRVYKFIGIDGQQTQIKLDPEDKLLPVRCPVDGCFFIWSYSGKDHEATQQECPCCGYDLRTSLEFYTNTLKGEVKQGQNIEKNLTIVTLLATRENPIKKANLEGSLQK